MPRKIRRSVRALVIALAGLSTLGSFGIATAEAVTREPAAASARPATARLDDARHAIAMPFFSFRRRT